MTLYPVTAFLTALLAFGIGVFSFLRNPRGDVNRRMGVLSLSVVFWSVFLGFMFLSKTAQAGLRATRLLQVGATFIPITYFHAVLALMGLKAQKRSWLILGYLVTIPLAGLCFTPLYIRGVTYQSLTQCYYPVAGPLQPLYMFLFFLYPGIAWIWMSRLFPRATGLRKNQILYILIASVIGFIGGSSTFPLWHGIQIPPLGTHVVLLSTAIIAIPILWYRFAEVTVAMARTVVFLMVYALVLGLPLLAALSWQSQLEQSLGTRWWVWLWVLCALLAGVAHSVNLYFQRLAENRLLAQRRRYHETLRRASVGMTRIRALPRLLKLIVCILTRTMRLSHASLYLFDPAQQRYVPMVSRGIEKHLVGVTVGPDQILIRYLQDHKDAVVTEEILLRLQQGSSAPLRDLADELRQLEAGCVIPSFVRDHLKGFVVIGDKRLDRVYTDEDLKVLMTLANQAALAIENAEFYEAEKERQAVMFHSAQLASLGTLAASMGHQINNRFHAECIVAGGHRAFLKSVDLKSVSAPVQEAIQKTIVGLEKIEKDAIRGGDVVKTFLNFAKPGKMERLDFGEIVRLTTELVQYRVKFEEIDFEWALEESLPLMEANKNQLTEVFYNLIANSYDAIKNKEGVIQKGELTLPTAHDYKGKVSLRVTCFTKNSNHWLKIVVQDNGIGVRPEDLPKLFVPFFTTKASSQKGTGLGLYIIKKIIESHWGEIEVSSVYAEGTSFTIRLPGVSSQARKEAS